MPKYNVTNLSADLKIDAGAVRVLLRKSKLEKPGPVWGWDTKTEYEAVLKTLKAAQSAPAADKKAAAKAPSKAAATGKAKPKA